MLHINKSKYRKLEASGIRVLRSSFVRNSLFTFSHSRIPLIQNIPWYTYIFRSYDFTLYDNAIHVLECDKFTWITQFWSSITFLIIVGLFSTFPKLSTVITYNPSSRMNLKGVLSKFLKYGNILLLTLFKQIWMQNCDFSDFNEICSRFLGHTLWALTTLCFSHVKNVISFWKY